VLADLAGGEGAGFIENIDDLAFTGRKLAEHVIRNPEFELHL
jgi:hypothetical protein